MQRTTTWIGAVLGGVLLATSALAVPVETTTGLNLRTGPGVRYPVLATMPAGEIVDLRGCEGVWCVVAYRGALGWASGRHLARIPFRPEPRPRVPFLDWLAPPRQAYPVEPLAPPPGRAPPRVIESPAPRPAPTRRARPEPERPAERAAPAGDSGVLTGASPTVSVPRDDAAPEQGAPPGAQTAPLAAPARPAPRAAGESSAAPSGEEAEPTPGERLRRRTAPTGGSGADVL
jgi:hypothetical protein